MKAAKEHLLNGHRIVCTTYAVVNKNVMAKLVIKGWVVVEKFLLVMLFVMSLCLKGMYFGTINVWQFP